MATNGIRISSPITVSPKKACMPLSRSKRWESTHEYKGARPLVKVFLTQSAYSRIVLHSTSELDDEVGGALIGLWCVDRDSEEEFVVVQHMLPALHTRQGSVYLTFTQDTILHFHDEIEKNHSGKRIVGWYHTHPRMGIFLSHYDTFLHNNFFPEPWQVALVVEPHKSLAGFFIRRDDGALDPTRYFGFYELNGNLGRSMVDWNNLQGIEDELESERGNL
jgi:proteasome lid subunit RPN8/RPN11